MKNWRPFTERERHFLHFTDEEMRLRQSLRQRKMTFWNDYFPYLLDPDSDSCRPQDGKSCFDLFCNYVRLRRLYVFTVLVYIYFMYIYVYIHSFIPDIYIAPLQETYSEALSLQLQSKRNVLRSLQKEDTLFWGSKRSVRGSCMHAYINTLIHVWLLFFVLYLFYYCFLSFQFYLTLLRMMRLAKKP